MPMMALTLPPSLHLQPHKTHYRRRRHRALPSSILSRSSLVQIHQIVPTISQESRQAREALPSVESQLRIRSVASFDLLIICITITPSIFLKVLTCTCSFPPLTLILSAPCLTNRLNCVIAHSLFEIWYESAANLIKAVFSPSSPLLASK